METPTYRTESPNPAEKGQVCIGPMPLLDALEAAEWTPAGPQSRVRLAETVPHGDCVAMQFPKGHIFIRKKQKLTGHSGSLEGSGEWKEYKPGDWTFGQWRPI